MKWTYDWLTDYLKTDASADVIADTLTRIGLEIDDVSSPVMPIAAKIIECKPHENSDHLHVLQVDDGSGKLRQVVCGAPNARTGIISALAVPGCIIGGHEIQSGKLRGVLSDGMMCSEKELGLSDNHDGIIELPTDTIIGAPVLATETVFDAGITPNRPDYLAVRGIAADLAAAGIGKYFAPNNGNPVATHGGRGVKIDTDKCAVYRFAEIHDIKMAPSNDKIARRLHAIGINPKNAPIDATNYVCFDMGQPMHCFDADAVSGNITVRMAETGEKFTDLFGTEHELTDADIVITDDAGILALAGVVGGARAMTTNDTKNIILESAYFDPVSVRKTAKRIGMSTDASYRYERGIDPTISGPALQYAMETIMHDCGGTVVAIESAGKNPVKETVIKYSPDMFVKKMGLDVPTDTQMNILKSLGYEIVARGNTWHLTPPARRVDVEIPETVIADIARIYGYDKFNKALYVSIDINETQYKWNRRKNQRRAGKSALKHRLLAQGLNEIISFGFSNSKQEDIVSDKKHIVIVNPIVETMNTARNSLIPNMLNIIKRNQSYGNNDLALFEIGNVFDEETSKAEHNQIVIARTGRKSNKHWMHRDRDFDIFDVKSDLLSLFPYSEDIEVCMREAPKWANPYVYGNIVLNNDIIATFAEVHPIVLKQFGIKGNVLLGVIDNANTIPKIVNLKQPQEYLFQPRVRDFSFILDKNISAGDITTTAKAAHKLITDVAIFDIFDMGDGKKSIAFTITIQPDKNMTDDDFMQIQNAVIAAVEQKCGAQIRDK